MSHIAQFSRLSIFLFALCSLWPYVLYDDKMYTLIYKHMTLKIILSSNWYMSMCICSYLTLSWFVLNWQFIHCIVCTTYYCTHILTLSIRTRVSKLTLNFSLRSFHLFRDSTRLRGWIDSFFHLFFLHFKHCGIMLSCVRKRKTVWLFKLSDIGDVQLNWLTRWSVLFELIQYFDQITVNC